MRKHRIVQTLCLGLTLLSLTALQAIPTIEDSTRFEKQLADNELVIAYCFTHAGRKNSDPFYKETTNMIDALQKGNNGISSVVRLIKVNIAKAKNASLVARYGLQKTPVILFFENGTLRTKIDGSPFVEGAQPTIAALAGAIRETIQKLWGARIIEIQEQRIKDAQYQAATEPAVSVGFGFWPYWGYPYWGYPYGPWVYPGLVW